MLQWALERSGMQSGTIHLATGELLELRAQVGLPDVVLAKVQQIPFGKGMAGLAASRREPVSVCNLQTDDSGDVRPGAKATGLSGSIAVPMLAGDGSVRGVLGVAQATEHDFTEAEIDALLEVARRMAEA